MAGGSAIASTQMVTSTGTSGVQSGKQTAKADGGFQKLLDSKAQADSGSKEAQGSGSKDAKVQDTKDSKVQDTKETQADKPVSGKEETGKSEGEVMAAGSLEQAQTQAALLFQIDPEVYAGVEEMPEAVPAETAVMATEALAEAVPVAEVPMEAAAENVVAGEAPAAQTEAKPVEETAFAAAETRGEEEPKEKTAKEAVSEKTVENTSQQEENAAASVQTAHEEVHQGKEPAIKAQVPMERVPVQEPEEIPEKVLNQMLAKTAEGIREFEIQLEPEELGKILIKVAFVKEAANVSIVCTEQKTMELMAKNARDIGAIMSNNLGSPTTIVVEDKEPGYLEQHNQGDGQGHAEQNQEQQQQRQQQKQQKNESLDFLQQLRLGLV